MTARSQSTPKRASISRVSNRKVTVPVPFHFQLEERAQARPNEVIVSKELSDLEECKKQFQARPLPEYKPVPESPHPSTKSLTKPKPFSLSTEKRAAFGSATRTERPTQPMNRHTPTSRAQRELADLEECKKQFHARPMPNLEYKPPPQSKNRRPITVSQPFALSPRNPQTAMTTPHEVVVTAKHFRARPLPRSTFESPPVAKKITKGPTGCTKTSAAVPPRLVSSARAEKRQVANDEFRKSAERKAKEKDEAMQRKRREKQEQEILKSTVQTPPTPTSARPFHLLSEARHEACQKQQAKQKKQEEDEQRRQMSFRAKEFVPSTPPTTKVSSDRPRTEPCPFQLQSTTRHELAQQVIHQSQQEEERERQSLAHFKAQPIPLSTYCDPEKTVSTKNEPVQVVQPHLQSTESAAKRLDFDEHVNLKRQVETVEQRESREQVATDDTKQMQERQSLPAKERGIVTVATSVQATSHEETRGGETVPVDSMTTFRTMPGAESCLKSLMNQLDECAQHVVDEHVEKKQQGEAVGQRESEQPIAAEGKEEMQDVRRSSPMGGGMISAAASAKATFYEEERGEETIPVDSMTTFKSMPGAESCLISLMNQLDQCADDEPFELSPENSDDAASRDSPSKMDVSETQTWVS